MAYGRTHCQEEMTWLMKEKCQSLIGWQVTNARCACREWSVPTVSHNETVSDDAVGHDTVGSQSV